MDPFAQKTDMLTKLKVTTALGDSLLNSGIAVGEKALRSSAGLKSLNPRNKDGIEFALDLIILLFGPAFLEQTVNGVFRKIFAKDSDGRIKLEKQLKSRILQALCYEGCDVPLPADFYTPGYIFPVKMMDLFDLYRISPNTGEGALAYGGDAGKFDRSFFSRVLSTASSVNDPQAIDGLRGIEFGYDVLMNTVTLTANITDTSVTVREFFTEILDDPELTLINAEKITIDVLDILFGFITQKKSKRGVENEEMLRDIIDSIPSDTEEKEVVYTFNPKSIEDISQRADKRRTGGFSVDLGCSFETLNIPYDDIEKIITQPGEVKGVFSSVLSNQLESAGIPMSEPMRHNYYHGLVKALTIVLLRQTILSPRIWSLFLLSKTFQVGYPQTGYNQQLAAGFNRADIQGILESRKSIVKELIQALKGTILDYVLERILKEVGKRIAPLQAKVAQEQAQGYERVMGSFAKIKDVIGTVNSGLDTANSVIGKV